LLVGKADALLPGHDRFELEGTAMGPESLESLREQIRLIDRDLVELAARRVALGKRVGEIKRRQGISTVDYAQERAVLDRARSAAREHGVDPRMAEDFFTTLIRASVTAQAEDSMRSAAPGAGKSAVVVGGAGRMGRWLRHFLRALGYSTDMIDPAAAPDDNARARQALPEAELVVCSIPPTGIAKLYDEFAAAPPAGVVVDIASVKTPVIGPIRALQQRGVRVASIHPMFGPSAVLLRDADVVVCDTGDAEATAVIERLFQPTTARLVRLPLEDHDRIMADLLSLAHATAIAFALALPRTEHPVRSTTFQALEALAAAVVRECPEVYYEIQAGNPHSVEALERLRLALDGLVASIKGHDSEGFRSLFAEGRSRTPEAV
jgi:chorismate mutase/prephenate dehydrogenase